MLRRILTTALCAFLVLTAQAAAQPEMFRKLSLKEAIEESSRSHRLLVVYLRGRSTETPDPYKLMEETTWKSPTLRDWMIWHGLAVTLDLKDDHDEFESVRERILPLIPSDCFYDPAEKPTVAIFRNGQLERTIPDFRFQAYMGEKNPVYNSFSTPPSMKVFYPKALTLLYNLDFYMDTLRAKDPGWMAVHDQQNPVPPRPDSPPPLYPVRDEYAAAFSEGDGDVLRVLDEAREQVKYGALFDATGPYTWLWEAGGAKDPGLLALRNTVVADEIAALCGRRDGTRQRFLRVRDSMVAVQPWWTYVDLYDWMTLSRAAGEMGSVIEYFHTYMNDEQDATIVGHADRAAFALLTGEGGPSGEPLAPAQLAAWVDAQAALLAAAAPRGITAEEWAKVQGLRRRMLVDNACRAYVALLTAKDDARAEAVATNLLKAVDDGVTRVSLVATAAGAGEVRPERHAALLAEAAAKGEDRPALMERVRAGKKE